MIKIILNKKLNKKQLISFFFMSIYPIFLYMIFKINVLLIFVSWFFFNGYFVAWAFHDEEITPLTKKVFATLSLISFYLIFFVLFKRYNVIPIIRSIITLPLLLSHAMFIVPLRNIKFTKNKIISLILICILIIFVFIFF